MSRRTSAPSCSPLSTAHMLRRLPLKATRSSFASSRSSVTTSSSLRRRAWMESDLNTTPRLQPFSEVLPLAVEVPLEVEVAHVGAGDEFRLQLQRIGVETPACHRHLAGQDDRRVVQRDEVDLAAG